ncbi:hypothetical protein AB3S75_003287 [Citrus x aurantiifolia]
MDGVTTNQNNKKDKRGTRLAWTKEEEEPLLNILEKMVARGFYADCGQLKPSANRHIEEQLAKLLPNVGLKASPHVESKMQN